MAIRISSQSDFYEGWAAEILGLAIPPDMTPEWWDGYQEASDQARVDAILALRSEIDQGNVSVEYVP